MNKKYLLLLVFFIVIVVNCCHRCCVKKSDTDYINICGTIKFLSEEGGFYGIIGDDKKNYDPMNLPDEFKKDGVRIKIKARLKPEIPTFRMWGTVIEIIEATECQCKDKCEGKCK